MLNPSSSDTPAASDEAGQRARTKPAPVALEIDPSWRAGKKLEEARRQLGLSFEQVSHRIKVRREFLEALEAMNPKQLPGRAYAMAYLRSYAAVLGLDAQAIVEQFQEESALSREDATPQIRSPESRPHPERPWLAAALLIVIAAGFVGWRALQSPGDEAAAPQVTSDPAPTAQEGAAPGYRQIEIRALAEGWLEVRGPDGTVFLSRVLRLGEVYRPDASPGWTIHARDGGAFQVYIDGAPAGPLGTAGMPVLGRQLDTIEPLPAAPTGPVARPSGPSLVSGPPPAPTPAAAPAAEQPAQPDAASPEAAPRPAG